MKKIVIAGATGFVGSGIVNELLTQGYEITALVRNRSDAYAENDAYREHECDLFDPGSYASEMTGAYAVINSIGIIQEKPSKNVTFERIHTKLNQQLLHAAKESGAGRYILISALGVRPDGVSRYQTSKWAAEQEIISSGLDYGIFRPSFVLGEGSGFLQEIAPVVKFPLVPVFGDGEYRFQPVHRSVLAKAVAALLGSESSWNRVYEVRREESYSYKEILQAIGRWLGRKNVRLVHVPVWMVKLGVRLFGWLPFFPITMDQLNMLLEGNVGAGHNAVEEFDLEWYELDEALERSSL